MVLANFQFSYGLLVFGADTSFGVEKWDWSMPPITLNSQARTRQDGFYPGLDLAQIRPITIDFIIPNLGDGNYYVNREAWITTFTQIPEDPIPLSWLTPDYPTARRFYCRPRKRSMPEDNVSAVASTAWSVELARTTRSTTTTCRRRTGRPRRSSSTTSGRTPPAPGRPPRSSSSS